MTLWTPVLYFAEKSSNDSNDEEDLPEDWQFCVVYDGLDTYTLYGYRNSSSQSWDMTFLSRESLARFLLKTLSPSCTVNTNLYVVDEDSLWRDNFHNYNSSWKFENELYSRESLWSDTTFNQVMDHLLLLRDVRVN
jgi:hypothetical protein